MRTSAVGFTPSFFRPLVSDEPEPSRPAGQKQEPLIYSSQKHGRLEEFIARADFKQFREEYKAVFKGIKAFVQDHANNLTPPLSEEIRNKVNTQFDALEKRLFDARGEGFDTPVAKENMYGAGKRIFHEFDDLLQDKGILLQNRMNAVLTLTGRLEFCFGGIASDLSDATAILMACKYGLKGHAQQWKIKMLDDLILQHVKDNHYPYIPGEEIHFVNAYYNYLADEMGVTQREDSYVRSYQGNIHPEQLEACKRHARANLTPMRLAAYAADHYRSRIEEFLSNENIKKDGIDEDGFNKLKEMMKALIPEYGDVALPVIVEPDPDTYQVAYSGRQQPVRGTRHFLKAFRKLGVIDYDKQSKVVLGQIEEGRIAMRGDLLYVKEQKRATPYELTASSLFKLAPEELLANMEKAEPEDMEVCSAMLRMVIHHAYQAVTAEGDAEEQLETWLRGFAKAMKERPSWPQGWTDPVMLLAAFFGKAAALRDLLEAGGDKDAVEENGVTVLMLAVQERHVEAVEVLLEKEADIEAKDAEGRTALMWAAEADHAGMAAALLEKEANIEAKDAKGRTALMWAAGMGHTGVAEILLEKEADIETKDSKGRTALMWAAINGHAGVTAALLAKGVNIEATDQNGRTALIFAADRGHAGVVEALLAKGANIEATDQDGNTALIFAADRGHGEVVAALLEKEANTEAKNRHGSTPLILAVAIGHTEVVEALLEAEADKEVTDQYGRPMLVLASQLGHAGVVEVLLKEGVNIEVKDPKERTALILAAANGHAEVAAALLTKGANIEATDQNGRTALISAADRGHAGVVEALLAKGANIEATDQDGNTALIFAADRGHGEVVAALLEKEANTEAKNRHGSTPLILAVAIGHTEVVEALLEAEADKEVTDQHGRSMLVLASQLGHAEVVEALLKKGADKETKDRLLLIAAGRMAEGRMAEGRMAEGRDHAAVVEVLLKEGADIEAKGLYGRTPLLLATIVGHIGTVKTLLEKGANIEAKDEMAGFNILMWAAIFGQIEAAKVLMQHGAGGNEALKAIAMKKSQVGIFSTPSLWGKVKTWVSGGDEAAIKAATTLLQAGADGVTALLELAEQDAGSSLRFLIKAGADKARDAQGKTALMKAVEMTVSDNDSDSEKGTKVLKALLDAGADESIKDNEGRTAEEHAERAAGLENNKAFRVFLEVAVAKKEGSWALWR